ncbi:hypothetical protein [Rhizobium mesoamericanum]|uniref:hypothetical protein n=1 Tax=Rhizobium mesoamericanum TaxID=1079800 RepID=UPI0027D8AAB5|nr:hypothetical protein [Rhizobium mesoamericanum]
MFNPHDLGAVAARFSAIPQIELALEILASSPLTSGMKFLQVLICGNLFPEVGSVAMLLELFTNMDLTKPTELVNY